MKSVGQLLLAGCTFAMCSLSVAQTYPSKPVRLVVPFPAGGPTDIVGRTIGQKLSESLGHSVAFAADCVGPAAKEVVDRLHKETLRVLALADVKERLSALGFEPVGNTPEQFAVNVSIELVAMVIVGGLGSIIGSYFGAAFILLLPGQMNTLIAWLSKTLGLGISIESLAHIPHMIYGATIILVLLIEPMGLGKLYGKGLQDLDAAYKAAFNTFNRSTGVLTYGNAPLEEAVRMAPEDMLVLETDAPYLEPEPRSLKRNEPSLLTRVIARLCELRGWTPQQAVTITRRNARDLFRLPIPADA